MEHQKIVCATVIVCEKTTVNQHGILSIHTILPEIHVQLGVSDIPEIGVPKRTGLPLELVVVWHSTANVSNEQTTHFKIRFTDPAGAVLFEDVRGSITMREHIRTFYSVIKMEHGLLCAQPGTHTIIVIALTPSGEEQVLFSTPFTIRMFQGQNELPV